MNGILWKWTNYYSGWQPRWFVLQDGILSYYKSEDEVHCGSKGSINLSVCDVNVCNYDITRFEIFVPGEQKYHLKASNTQERQRWIVALGSCKACHREPEYENEFVFQPNIMKGQSALNVNVSDLNCKMLMDEIQSKESEMRIFLDLINNQTQTIKNLLEENKIPDMEVLNESTSTLNAACDTFTTSIKELMVLASTNVCSIIKLTNQSSPVSPNYSQPITQIGSPIMSQMLPSNRKNSYSECGKKKHISLNNGGGSLISTEEKNCIKSLDDNENESLSHNSLETTQLSNQNRKIMDSKFSFANSTTNHRRDSNFFSLMAYSFVDIVVIESLNLQLDAIPADNPVKLYKPINTSLFIASFSSLLSFLDKFSISAISTLKLDIGAYLQRLTQKYESDKNKFSSLESIIENEHKTIQNSSTELPMYSALYSIRNLNRVLVFLVEFFNQLNDWLNSLICESVNSKITNSEMTNQFKSIIQTSYEKTLKDKVNWIDRGLFSVILKALPDLNDFLIALFQQDSSPLLSSSISISSYHEFLAENKSKISQLLLDLHSYKSAISIIVDCIVAKFNSCHTDIAL